MVIHREVEPHHWRFYEKAFASKSEHTKHMKIQSGEKPHECSYCDKDIKVHTGEKPHYCSHCEMTFVQRGHLTYHMKIHTGERPYSCTHCEKVLYVKVVL